MKFWRIGLAAFWVGTMSLYAPKDAFSQRGKKVPLADADTKVSSNKQQVEGELVDAMREKIVGNLTGSRQKLEAFVTKYPEIAAGHYELADIHVLQRRYSEALVSYKKAVDIESENKWYGVGLAELYDFLKMYNESKEVYKKLAISYPSDNEFALSAASISVQQGKFDEALDVLNRNESQIGITDAVGMEKYRIYMGLKKFPEALRELEKLQETFPNETLYLGMSAEIYHAKGDTKKAFETYQKILKNDSNNVLIHLAIADFYQKENQPEKAFYHLEKAFVNQSVDIDKKVMVMLGMLDLAKKSEVYAKETEKLARLLTEAHPDSPKSWSIAGDLALETKDWRQASACFQKVISIDASRFIFFRQVAELSYRTEDFETLKFLSEMAEEMYPMQPETYLYKAQWLIAVQRLSDAEEALGYGKALVVDNNVVLSDFMAMFGVLYSHKKEMGKAVEYFEKSVVYAPNNYRAFWLYGKSMDGGKKLSMIDKSISLAGGFPETHAAKALYMLEKGKTDEALVSIQKSLANGGNQVKNIVLLYADILDKKGESQKALEVRENAEIIK